MKRLNPVGTLLGYVLTLLLIVGLGISLWVNRGLAFNPGPVTSKRNGLSIKGFTSHADFEKQCGTCHDPLRTEVATKCLECHVDVSHEIQTGEGVHSAILAEDKCNTCHPEHRGRDFDPTMASYQLFDHSTTSFSLNWHQQNYDTTPMQCAECHSNDSYSVVENRVCLDCHAGHDQEFGLVHLQDYGEDCLACHDGLDRMQNFDHSQTGYSLIGEHDQLNCIDCHQDGVVTGTPKECQDCHNEPTIHQSLFEPSCSDCHTPEGWSPAKLEDQPFAHFETTGFSLVLHQVDFNEQATSCATCHPKDLKLLDIQTCITCHDQHDPAFMADHQQQFGIDCMVCHDGVDRLSDFEHATFFPLDGKHGSIECLDCHVDNVYRGTPQECWQCHQEPDIHMGVFGLSCDDCHTSEAWSPATLLKHDFPLDHGVQENGSQLQCDSCHTTNYIEYTCYNCHEHQADEMSQKHISEGISEQQLPECAKCHPDGNLTNNSQD